MKKKILSFALCLTMVATSFTAFPVVTNAAEPEAVPQEATVTEEQAVAPEEATTDTDVKNETAIRKEEQQSKLKQKELVQNENKGPIAEENNNVITNNSETNKTENEVRQYVPKTVSITDAGPFMKPVSVVAPMMRSFAMSKPYNPDADGNGLALSKKAEKNPDGSYKITMEAYTTGKVSSSEKSVPVDVTLVLDQSGSMDNNFAGISRQEAMKKAVTQFINSVGSKYDENTADHRISLVEFRSGAKVLQPWTKADVKGVSSLKSKVSKLNAEGATNVGAGMQKAETLMDTEYKYTGSNTERQKVVIVFTDGVPTTSSDFHTGVANTAIKAAKNLKDSGCTVYSIGIFDGADPNELYGSKFSYAVYKPVPCTGEVGSVWGGSWLSGLTGDVRNIDIAAGNRFLNYISNNYGAATEIGILEDTYNPGNYLVAGGKGWKITKKFNRTAPADENYYLSAKDSTELDKIFQTIAEQIQTPTINLGAGTVVKDVVTTYFNMPAKKSDIKVYTSDYDGKVFKDRVPAQNVNVEMQDRTVKVTGFDYNENFVSDTAKKDNTFGKKLIIEFDVTARDEFLGGNNVPTNVESESALYDSAANKIEAFEVPHVNVPLKEYEAVAEDINVYLNGEVTKAELEAKSKIKFFGNKTFNELDKWQSDFVNYKEIVAGEVSNAKEDSKYTVTGQLTPKYKGDVKDGPKVTATANINVFTPEVTFKDLEGYYGDGVPVLNDAFVGDTEWTHNGTNAKDVTMEGKAPNLTYSSDLTGMQYIDTIKDIPVKVTANIGTDNVTEFVKFNHKKCVPECGFNSKTEQFLVHVKTCTLNVTKKLTGNLHDSDDEFIMHVKGNTNLSDNPDLQFTVKAGETKTIKNLPVGTYNVTEDKDWSKRYEISYEKNTDVLSKAKDSGVLVVNNKLKTENWLSDVATIVNEFKGTLH